MSVSIRFLVGSVFVALCATTLVRASTVTVTQHINTKCPLIYDIAEHCKAPDAWTTHQHQAQVIRHVCCFLNESTPLEHIDQIPEYCHQAINGTFAFDDADIVQRHLHAMRTSQNVVVRSQAEQMDGRAKQECQTGILLSLMHRLNDKTDVLLERTAVMRDMLKMLVQDIQLVISLLVDLRDSLEQNGYSMALLMTYGGISGMLWIMISAIPVKFRAPEVWCNLLASLFVHWVMSWSHWFFIGKDAATIHMMWCVMHVTMVFMIYVNKRWPKEAPVSTNTTTTTLIVPVPAAPGGAQEPDFPVMRSLTNEATSENTM